VKEMTSREASKLKEDRETKNGDDLAEKVKKVDINKE